MHALTRRNAFSSIQSKDMNLNLCFCYLAFDKLHFPCSPVPTRLRRERHDTVMVYPYRYRDSSLAPPGRQRSEALNLEGTGQAPNSGWVVDDSSSLTTCTTRLGILLRHLYHPPVASLVALPVPELHVQELLVPPATFSYIIIYPHAFSSSCNHMSPSHTATSST